jgi:hypothetical protein
VNVPVLKLPLTGVPRVGVINEGLVRFAFRFNAVVVALDTGLLASLVLSTLLYADAIALNSASMSTPLTSFAGLPVRRVSLAVKLVILVYAMITSYP